MQTMLWPDEVRRPEFDSLSEDIEPSRPSSRWPSLVETLAADFDPDEYEDDYQQPLAAVVRRQARGR